MTRKAVLFDVRQRQPSTPGVPTFCTAKPPLVWYLTPRCILFHAAQLVDSQHVSMMLDEMKTYWTCRHNAMTSEKVLTMIADRMS